jgi:hypothetical protein
MYVCLCALFAFGKRKLNDNQRQCWCNCTHFNSNDCGEQSTTNQILFTIRLFQPMGTKSQLVECDQQRPMMLWGNDSAQYICDLKSITLLGLVPDRLHESSEIANSTCAPGGTRGGRPFVPNANCGGTLIKRSPPTFIPSIP